MEIHKKIYSAAFIGMVLLTIPIISAYAATEVTQPEAVDTSVYSEDEKVLRAQADDYVKAFAAGDYKTITNMWAPDGTFTDIDGRILHGRAAIELYFKTNFERSGGQSLEIAIDSLKFLGNDVALEEGRSRLLEGPAINVVSHYSVVHIKQNDKWQMSAVTETACPEALKGSLQDWEWLIGNWSAKPSSTKTLHLIAAWAVGHKFIRCLFEIENTDGGIQAAMLVIGRDPNSGQIISWHFDPTGGYGSGKWIKDGQTWIEKASSVEADGTKGSALYILHKLDNNTFTWRSTQRYLGNSQLPDSDEVKISREQTAGK